MKRLSIALALLLFASCGTSTTEPTTEPTASADVPMVESTPEVVVAASEKVNEIISRYEDERNEFVDAYRQASSRQEKRKIAKEMSPKAKEFADELMVIVDENPDDPEMFSALKWIATNVRRGEMHDTAMETLFDRHIEHEDMKDICSSLSRGRPSETIEQRLDTLIERSPHEEVRGLATFTLANYLARLPDMVEYVDDPRLAKSLGEDGVAYLKNFVQNDNQVEALYMSVVNDYGHIEAGRDATLGERAEKALFALRYLAIGKVAPDIEGEDLDGESFKLSEYRGKVVMLDFWGDW